MQRTTSKEVAHAGKRQPTHWQTHNQFFDTETQHHCMQRVLLFQNLRVCNTCQRDAPHPCSHSRHIVQHRVQLNSTRNSKLQTKHHMQNEFNAHMGKFKAHHATRCTIAWNMQHSISRAATHVQTEQKEQRRTEQNKTDQHITKYIIMEHHSRDESRTQQSSTERRRT